MTTAAEKIEALHLQIEQLKDRAILEVKVKLAEARHVAADLEAELEKMTGKAAPAKSRKPRVSVTIDQVVQAIKGGATNYKKVADVLGCSPATVTKKIEIEGGAAGIKSAGQKASFKLLIK